MIEPESIMYHIIIQLTHYKMRVYYFITLIRFELRKHSSRISI
jgi:hypothetical protein